MSGTNSGFKRAFGDLKAHHQGYRAYMDGVVVGDNPYKERDEHFWHWMEGWAAAGMDKAKGRMVNYADLD